MFKQLMAGHPKQGFPWIDNAIFETKNSYVNLSFPIAPFLLAIFTPQYCTEVFLSNRKKIFIIKQFSNVQCLSSKKNQRKQNSQWKKFTIGKQNHPRKSIQT